MSMLTDTELAAIAASQDSTFSRDQAIACGLTPTELRWQLQRGSIISLARNVFAFAGSSTTWRRQLWAAVLEGGEGAAVSHRSAAALFGLPGFPEGPVEITRRETHSHRTHLSTIHTTFWLPEHHVTRIAGLPCTILPRCVFELAALSSPKRLRRGLPYVHEDKVERTYDNATRLGLTNERAAEVVATLGKRGKPGTQLMRRILDERDEGYACTESELEDLVRSVLAAHGLAQPDRQRVLGGDMPAGRVDFVYLLARIVIEADSRKHHTALLDRRNDSTRDLDLAAAGFAVIRVTYWDLVHQPWKFIAAVRAQLNR